MASRIDLGWCVVVMLAGCPPSTASDDTSGDEAEDSNAEATPGETGDTDPTGEDVPAECAVDDVTRAGFTLDVGDWPVAGDTLVMDAACEVTSGAPNIGLSCVDEAENVHAITLTIDADAPFVAPEIAGSVRLGVVRAADGEDDTGVWTLRDADLGLLLGGNHGNYSQPMEVASFFAPLNLGVDDSLCEEIFIDNCFTEQRFVIEVSDAMGVQRVPHGRSTVVRSGHRLHVERAAMTRAFEDPKNCAVDASTPRVYRFLIAAG